MITTIIIKIDVNLRMPMNGEFFPIYPWIIHEPSIKLSIIVGYTMLYSYTMLFSHINAKRTP